MIALHNIAKSYPLPRGKKVVLDDVNITFRPGENMGILGLNGAGKSSSTVTIASPSESWVLISSSLSKAKSVMLTALFWARVLLTIYNFYIFIIKFVKFVIFKGFTNFNHKGIVEINIMNNCQSHSKHFSTFEKMSKICTREILAKRTITL